MASDVFPDITYTFVFRIQNARKRQSPSLYSILIFRTTIISRRATSGALLPEHVTNSSKNHNNELQIRRIAF